MFSKLSISAIPIIDDEGIVLNLYETVDVMVRISLASTSELLLIISTISDPCATWSIHSAGHDNRGSAHSTLTRFPWRCRLHGRGLPGHSPSAHQDSTRTSSSGSGRRGSSPSHVLICRLCTHRSLSRRRRDKEAGGAACLVSSR